MKSPVYQAVSVVGVAQMIAHAASHYLPAVIAIPASRDLDISIALFFAGFSLALAISGVTGPMSGRLLDRIGGRPVLMLSNLVFASGFSLLALAEGALSLFLSYFILGVGMAMGLFESAFSAIVHLIGKNSRNAITGVTLIAGLASAIGWTVSIYIENRYGWRGVCWFWALMHLCIALPLNACLPTSLTAKLSDIGSGGGPVSSEVTQETLPETKRSTSLLLAYIFGVSAFIGMGLMSHLPRLIEGTGVPLVVAFSIGALVGPAQILGRIIDFTFMRRFHPLIPTRLAALTQPVGSAMLLTFGAPFAPLFVLLHGLGNGILIISRGTLPLALFGTKGYGQRQGWLMMPSKFAQASAPFLFGLAFMNWGTQVLWLTFGLGLSIFVALCLISTQQKNTSVTTL